MRSAKARRGYYVIDAQVPFIHTSQGNKAIRNADERENTPQIMILREGEGGRLRGGDAKRITLHKHNIEEMRVVGLIEKQRFFPTSVHLCDI